MPIQDGERRRRLWREWYARNKVTYRAKYEPRKQERREMLRDWMVAHKRSLSCVRCGFDNPAALQFHHRSGEAKILGLADAIGRLWSVKRLKEEMAKCDVLCANCHAIEHNGQRFTSVQI